MPRPLKPYKVDHVMSPNGYTGADVMFDRDKKKFFVEVVPGDHDSRVWSDTIVEVKKLAVSALANAQTYEWEALIEVSISEPWHALDDGIFAGVKLTFRRFERARNPSHPNRFVEREHELDACGVDGPRKRAREEHRDIHPYSGPDEIGPSIDEEPALLPYRQDVWDGLVAIQQSINDAYAKLEKLTKAENVSRLLIIAGRTGAAQALRGIALLTAGDQE